jgi:hypothetical protein
VVGEERQQGVNLDLEVMVVELGLTIQYRHVVQMLRWVDLAPVKKLGVRGAIL